MSYNPIREPNFSGLTIADDRFAAFEEIRDANDPLMQDRRARDKPLCDSDFFGILLIDSYEILHRKRLHASLERVKHTQAEEQMAAENERKQTAKLSF